MKTRQVDDASARSAQPPRQGRAPQAPHGFTLVELLVVIAIIGILVALLLPAVQAAREAARRAQCQNQLKQIGLALLNYESTNGSFPAGVQGKGVYPDDDPDRREVGPSWSYFALPYMEEQTVFDQFDFSGAKSFVSTAVNASGVSNAEAAGKPLELFHCPSEQDGFEPFTRFSISWAPGSYKGVAGKIDAVATVNPIYWDRLNSGQNAARTANKSFRGPLIAAGGLTDSNPVELAQIVDGTSKTALVGEGYAGPQPNQRPLWAVGWRYHNKGHMIRDAQGRSSIYRLPDVNKCGEPARNIPPGLGGEPTLCYRSFASPHAGGVIQFVFCDGSVHLVRDVIDDDIYLTLGTVGGEEVQDGEL